MNLKKFLILLAVLALLAAHPGSAQTDLPPLTQTMMVYIVGSDLETKWGLATADILEMMAARPDSGRINLLVMTGGADSWNNQSIPPDKLSIYRVTGSGPRLQHSMESASMGEADTLLAFMEYAVTHHPADTYSFIFWDHGGGPLVGIGADLLYQNDALSLRELESAFSRGPFRGERRLSWLAFDACLMASLEVASMMAPYARYLIASEETLPGAGFDYSFLKDYAASDLSGLSAGQAIIRHTAAYYEELRSKHPQREDLVTLSVMDLDRVAPAQHALDALFSDLQQGLEVELYSDIARARDGTKAYGRVSSTTDWDLVDLMDLSRNMSGLYPAKAGRMMDAIKGLVVDNYSNVPRSHGVSIYFPLLNKRMFSNGWNEIYKQFDFLPAYRAFVDQFGKILLADSLGQWTGSEAPVVSFDEQSGQYYIQLTPQQAAHYERAEYYVLARVSGEEFVLSHMSGDVTLDGDNRLTANFDGQVMAIYESEGKAPILPYMQEKEQLDGLAKYQIPALLTRHSPELGQEILSAELLADIRKASGEARITGAIRKEEDSLLGKKDVALYEWDMLYLPYTSFYLTRGADGAPLPVGDWVLSDNLRLAALPADQRIDLRLEPLKGEASEYFVMISVVDTQGYVYSSELMPLADAGLVEAPDESPAESGEAIKVPFPLSSAPASLYEGQDLSITLDGIDLSAQQAEPRRAPDTIHVRLSLSSKSAQDMQVMLDETFVNTLMMDAQSAVVLPAGGRAEIVLDLPIAPRQGETNLVDAGISLVETLGFKLLWQADSLMGAGSSAAQRFEIATDIAAGAGYEALAPGAEDIIPLHEEEGFTFEQYGAPFLLDGSFVQPLRVSNLSKAYDSLELQTASINGIDAHFTLPISILPGKTRVLHLRMDALKTILPPELSEFQYFYDGYDNLEALGIAEIGEISLRFGVFDSQSSGKAGGPDAMRLLAPFAIPLGEVDQPLDTDGTLLFEQEGVRVVRLASDPSGQSLFIQNSSGHTLRLSTFDSTKVDGVPYTENTAILLVLGPKTVAYTKLFAFLPGIYPVGEELEVRLILINLDENRLLLRSEPFSFPLSL